MVEIIIAPFMQSYPLKMRHVQTAAMVVTARAMGGRVADVEFMDGGSKAHIGFPQDENESGKILATWLSGDLAVRRVDPSSPLSPMVRETLMALTQDMEPDERESTIQAVCSETLNALNGRWKAVAKLAEELEVHQSTRGQARLSGKRIDGVISQVDDDEAGE